MTIIRILELILFAGLIVAVVWAGLRISAALAGVGKGVGLLGVEVHALRSAVNTNTETTMDTADHAKTAAASAQVMTHHMREDERRRSRPGASPSLSAVGDTGRFSAVVADPRDSAPASVR